MKLDFQWGFLRRWKYQIITVFVLLIFLLLIPPVRFNDPYSSLLLDTKGELLGARVASDGQWRFPPPGNLPEKYKKAVLCYEDRYYYYHPGINPISMVRALIQYLREGRIISGGSTLTMQFARISRKNPSRTIIEKLLESIISIRTELRYSKSSILLLYAAHAPFGSNVIGLEAASWRYFGVSPSQLSWAETATLAVLPNSPSLIFPGKNQKKLLGKRNHLLAKMFKQGIIDRQTYELALSEPVPGEPHILPRIAPHLLDRAIMDGFQGQRIVSTLDIRIQKRMNDIIERYYEMFSANGVNNAAALVISTRTGQVIGYVGNSRVKGEKEGGDVDMITAKRNFGSLLKPFLYAAMLNEGLLLPEMLVTDIPVSFEGYSPKNVLKTFEGAVPANEVLARSLNVPSVILLHNYGIGKFNAVLKELGMRTLIYPPEHYGLSIILGGAEGSLWELTSMYASLGNHLLYPSNDSIRITYSQDREIPGSSFYLQRFSPSATWFTLRAITAVKRPEDNGTLKYFYSRRKIGWKTGTSYGSRDAWAIGVTPEYTVGVWVGNANGEGRPGVTGIGCAAPVMFDIFDQLPASGWFPEPVKDMTLTRICAKSGCIAGESCPVIESRKIMAVTNLTKTCPYHRTVHLDPTGAWQVTDRCFSPSQMMNTSWFVLPPVQEYYYRQFHSDYTPLPPVRDDCRYELSSQNPIGLIYPTPGARIYLPLKGDQKRSKSIWKATHRNSGATLYWHLDNTFLAKTKGEHTIEVMAEPGIHTLTLIDDKGESLTIKVEIIGITKK
jgi:penicillin-binding protein 1C